jgi:DNA-binding response OmpR family regulator
MPFKVLAVDDEPDVRRLVQIKLKKAGYEVVTATNGEEGVESAIRENPDVILLDVRMPKMDGFEALAKIKADMSPAPIVIMLTGEGETEDLVQALSTGADDYIVKPFAPREVVARVNVALIKAGKVAENEE